MREGTDQRKARLLLLLLPVVAHVVYPVDAVRGWGVGALAHAIGAVTARMLAVVVLPPGVGVGVGIGVGVKNRLIIQILRLLVPMPPAVGHVSSLTRHCPRSHVGRCHRVHPVGSRGGSGSGFAAGCRAAGSSCRTRRSHLARGVR